MLSPQNTKVAKSCNPQILVQAAVDGNRLNVPTHHLCCLPSLGDEQLSQFVESVGLFVGWQRQVVTGIVAGRLSSPAPVISATEDNHKDSTNLS